MSGIDENALVQAAVVRWLNEVVIGLNLCPFASKPMRENRVRFVVSHATDDEGVLQDLHTEMTRLDDSPTSELETTLVIIPHHLHSFWDFNQFVSWTPGFIKRNGWKGIYQLATFHPEYCFSGAHPEDAENLTNRSPYPILHIIREASLEHALQFFEGVEAVPENNKRCMGELTPAQRHALFPYLFSGNL